MQAEISGGAGERGSWRAINNLLVYRVSKQSRFERCTSTRFARASGRIPVYASSQCCGSGVDCELSVQDRDGVDIFFHELPWDKHVE